jgi:protein SCO1/2
MRKVVWIVSGLLVVAGVALFWLARDKATKESYYAHKLSTPEEAYNFKLIDQNGKPFQLDQLRGKLVLLSFGFTHCPNICPTTLGNLAAMYRELPPTVQGRVQVTFVSVDPERDTPKVLKDYVPAFDEHFIGLTGAPDQIRKAAKAYGVVYERQKQPNGDAGDDYTINHSAYLYVIGPKGKWLAVYDYDQIANSEKIAKDVQRFLGSG